MKFKLTLLLLLVTAVCRASNFTNALTTWNNANSGCFSLCVGGDSIGLGFPYWRGYLEVATPGTNANCDIAQHGVLLAATYGALATGTNLAHSGAALNFACNHVINEIIPLKPKYIFFHCGVNDITGNSQVWTGYAPPLLSNLVAQVAQEGGELAISDVGPATSANNTQANNIDDWNTNLKAWIAAVRATNTTVYGVYTHDLMAVARATNSNKLQDLNPYLTDAGEGGLHINQRGDSILLAAWFDAIQQADGYVHIHTNNAATADQWDAAAETFISTNGEAVNIAAGTSSWTNALVNTNNLKIYGAGIDVTVLSNCIPIVSQVQTIFSNITTEPGYPRVSSMTINGGTNPGVSGFGQIRIDGNCKSVRIDHIKFLFSQGDRYIRFEDSTYGLIDHCQFWSGQTTDILVWLSTLSQNGETNGDYSWETPSTLGTTNAVVIEDNQFTSTNGPGGQGVVDAYEGGRFTFRYNNVTNDSVQSHGTESGGGDRGLRQFEVYMNNIIGTNQIATAILIRSGTGVIFSNTTKNFNYPANVVNYRNNDHFYPYWGLADGTNSWDSNSPTIFDSGLNTAGNGAALLTDNTKNWTVNQWVGYQLQNLTGKSNMASEITANTATTISYGAAGYSFTSNMVFSVNDSYQIRKSLFQLDGVGMGTSSPMNRASAAWLNQVPDPVYAWSNTLGGTLSPVNSKTALIVSGTNYINDAQKPGYTPLQYPHPMNDSDPPVTNLLLSSSVNPTTVGQTVVFTATFQTNAVTASDATGTVTFKDGANNTASATISSGIATLTTNSLALGTHVFVATYGGDSKYYSTTSTNDSQVVNLNTTTLTMANGSPNPSTSGGPVAFTVTVKTNGVTATDASGLVTFLSDGGSIGTASPVNGVATLNYSGLSVGTHAMTCTEVADAKYSSGSGTGTAQVVNSSGAAPITWMAPVRNKP